MSALPPLKSCHTATATHTQRRFRGHTTQSVQLPGLSESECGDVSELVRADCVSFLSKSGFRSPTVSLSVRGRQTTRVTPRRRLHLLSSSDSKSEIYPETALIVMDGRGCQQIRKSDPRSRCLVARRSPLARSLGG